MEVGLATIMISSVSMRLIVPQRMFLGGSLMIFVGNSSIREAISLMIFKRISSLRVDANFCIPTKKPMKKVAVEKARMIITMRMVLNVLCILLRIF